MTYLNRAGKVLISNSREMIYDIHSRQRQLSSKSHRTLLILFRHIEMDVDNRYPGKK